MRHFGGSHTLGKKELFEESTAATDEDRAVERHEVEIMTTTYEGCDMSVCAERADDTR